MGELKLLLKHAMENINTVIMIFTAICGFALQYSFSTEKGWRPVLFMLLCTSFTAGLLHFILEHYKVVPGDGLHTAAMTFSTFISVAFISLIVAVLSLVNKKAPEAFITRIADEIINRGKPGNNSSKNRSSQRRDRYDSGGESNEVDPYE